MLLLQTVLENQNAEKRSEVSLVFQEDSAEPGLRTQARRVSSGFRHKAELAQMYQMDGTILLFQRTWAIPN